MLAWNLLRMLLSVTVVTTHAQFQCPEMAPHCTCNERVAWWHLRLDYVNLKTVNCSYNKLAEIPDLSSLSKESFDILLLNNNNIKHLKKSKFANISVTEIVLRKNPLKQIDPDVFQDLADDLQSLDMDSARIKIDSGLPFLGGLHNLKILDLGYNQLKNKFKSFPSGIFSGLNLKSLKTLTLQALQMSRLDTGTFQGIEHLEQLDLSFNFLFEFPKEVLTLKNLKDLKLFTNDMGQLLNNTFKGLTKLRQLLIGINEIEYIDNAAFSDLEDSIVELNLYHNPLYKVPTEAIRYLTKLQSLSLVKTNLNDIGNGSFVGEYKLKELHLDLNPDLTFDNLGMFYGIEDSLEVIYLRTLNLTQLPLDVLTRLEKLRYLDASNNAFKNIDKHFFQGLHLSNIQLTWNKIQHVDHEAFEAFHKGVILNLHNNRLSDITFILEVEACTFDEVRVTDNSIKCDCHLEKVLNSGLVAWQILGECYVDADTDIWYDFKDPSLMKYLHTKCPRTSPKTSCFEVAPVSTSEHLQLLHYVYLVLCIVKLI